VLKEPKKEPNPVEGRVPPEGSFTKGPILKNPGKILKKPKTLKKCCRPNMKNFLVR